MARNQMTDDTFFATAAALGLTVETSKHEVSGTTILLARDIDADFARRAAILGEAAKAPRDIVGAWRAEGSWFLGSKKVSMAVAQERAMGWC